jgi:hypothetical protein
MCNSYAQSRDVSISLLGGRVERDGREHNYNLVEGFYKPQLNKNQNHEVVPSFYDFSK